MENIIAPIDRKKIIAELTDDKFVRNSNFGGNRIFVCDAHNAPNTMQEIGRLRELSFREAGGGTGKAVDIDEADLWDNPYKQLIVWNDELQEIIGGYRYIDCSEGIMFKDGQPELSTSEIFRFSQKFIDEYMPCTIELGRSFVQPKFQSRTNFRFSIYALDNLWDGLGAIFRQNEDHAKFFFGKVTMYTTFNTEARDMILTFLDIYFRDKEELVMPKEPISYTYKREKFSGDDFKADYRILNQTVRSLGENIPPLVNAYMNLSPTMKVFGTAINPFFGGVEETGILVNVNDIFPEKRERHIDTYQTTC